MSYSDDKSKNFAKYCKEGKINLVKKWIDDPNVSINWNKHTPLRIAVKENQVEVVKLLLLQPKLKTDYENESELKGSMTIKNGNIVSGIFNPFTQAMFTKNFTILDIFIKGSHGKKFKIDRIQHLDILLEMNDKELNDYFIKLDGFTDFILKNDSKYIPILSEEAGNIFLF